MKKQFISPSNQRPRSFRPTSWGWFILEKIANGGANRLAKVSIRNVFLVCLISLIAGCSPKIRVLMQDDYKRPSNPHLRFESDNEESLIVYKGFVVKYDTAHRVPSFVVHRIIPLQISDSVGIKAKRKNRFWIDQFNLADYSATSQDYSKSGYDRGHHAPAGDFVYSQTLNDESFVYTNISPQNAKLNRGVLAKLEGRIREKVLNCNCAAYVITGTYFQGAQNDMIGGNKVGVPTHIYKIVFFPQLGQMYAFLLDNKASDYAKDLFHHQKSVDDIEELTSEDFFELLRDEVESKLEKRVSTF